MLVKKIDPDRIGERTILNAGCMSMLALFYPTTHTQTSIWNRLNTTMNRGERPKRVAAFDWASTYTG